MTDDDAYELYRDDYRGLERFNPRDDDRQHDPSRFEKEQIDVDSNGAPRQHVLP